MSAAETDISTVEKDYQAFSEQLEILEQVRACVLWMPESDFRKVCSCDDCRNKIESLYEFEKEIKAKMRLIMAYHNQMDNNVDLCLSISASVDWTKWTLNFFQKKLKAVSEKAGVPWTELEDIDQEITQMLINSGLLGEPEKDENDDSPIVDDDESCDVLRNIEYGLFHYMKTKAKDKACAVLREMEMLEKEREMDMETAKAQNKSLGSAVSKNYIEKQIEVLMKLPVNELHDEMKEVIAKIRPRDHQQLFVEARQSMYDICSTIIGKKIEFWQNSPSLPNERNEHVKNGLKETLELLLDEVKSFKKKWGNNYACFYTPGDQSDPKRQQAE
ncbi:hypothetical protein CASFOL_012610 [Castilleja foliolosa]|uniref:Uncharacterized protein n=1 Tax=Castilleja foliolosa TaxID=1961234 RepID=A0ABD3DHL5_9LAMI